MKYKVFGDTLPAVTITLDKGESVYTQSGGMSWMDDTITMETNMKGGFFKSVARMFSGESLFLATYTSNAQSSEITIASSFPGAIVTMPISPGRDIICQKDAFLVATPEVELSVEFSQTLMSGAFGGEGFVLQRLAGKGIAWLECDGTVVEKKLERGQSILVDTGNLAAFDDTVSYKVESVKGFKNILFGGEGLFLTRMTGPGSVWLQTITIGDVAKKIIPFIPVQSE